jgi:hypothetical protein
MQRFAQRYHGIMLRNDDTFVPYANFLLFEKKEILKYCLSLQGKNMKRLRSDYEQ